MPGAARIRRASSSRSATCASCSSRRRRSRPAGTSSASDLGVEPERHPAGAARRLVRLVPDRRERGADRPRAEAAAARGSSRPATSPARARRSSRSRSRERAAARRDPRRGRVRRALRPRRLQRPLHRPARVPGMSARPFVACGALALHVEGDRARRGWRPRRPPAAARAAQPAGADRARRARRCAALRAATTVVVGYADCGSRGALDGRARGSAPSACPANLLRPLRRHRGHRRDRDEEPGTYFLTDFLVRTFDHLVWRGLGLDRHPELRDDYFGNYARVVWLAQEPTPALARAAEARRRRSSACRSRCARPATPASSRCSASEREHAVGG